MLLLRPAIAALLVILFAVESQAASVSRTYSYFSVQGSTLAELQDELTAQGPLVKSTGRKHPGATEIQFVNRLDYAQRNGRCRVSKAGVTVKARITLPRWTRPVGAAEDTRLIWGALSGDIRRHEESHVSIARSHARDMEAALLALPAQATCALAAEKGQDTLRKLTARHDEEQERFDRIERINFTARMDRLIRYRIEQIESGRIRN